jgi:uncharacterized phage protein (TIGR01671 family)
MEREILFRGKTKYGHWVEGYLFINAFGSVFIKKDEKTGKNSHHEETNIVIPETVGQFTGLTDKNGKKIFEGDYIRDLISQVIGVIVFDNACFSIRITETTNILWDVSQLPALFEFNNVEVVDNIFDNPELIK